ncbi:MAG: reverse transcriptase family protein, partial [Candidatus Thiodiazotropha sp.]
KCDSSGISPLRKDGVVHSDPQTKASILNNQFVSAFTEEDKSYLPTLGSSPYPNVPNFTIGTEGVKKLLEGLNPHKASGPDNIPTRFLKEAASEVAPALSLIFAASLSQGKVPDDWKTADVTPIFKKGDRSTASNYRPISLTAVCSKVMEHILHSQIMQHLDHHNILSDQQHGFRKKRSCESQLILTIQDLASGLEEGEQIDAILLDFSKAFDKVPHQRLLLKLHHYGIRGSLLSWIESFLTLRSQRVLVEGKSSSSVPVVSGVPQGTVLGPLLFLLYINDLPERVSSTARLFADDSLLYRRIKSEQDQRALQEDLVNLEKWEEDWQMSFNPSKCEVIRISKRRHQMTGSYSIHGHQLVFVKSGKYLGVTLTDNLSWNDHVDQVVKKANNSLAFLRRNLSSCPSQTKAQCYQSLVRPSLEYASTAWDPYTQTNINKLEAVQRRAARFVTGDYHTTSSVSDMINDLGWETLQQRRTQAKLVMMYRITHGLIDIPATQLLHPAALSTRGHSMRYLVPFCRIDAYRCSFFPSGIRLWNQLPESIATAPTLETFKGGLQGFF